VKSSESRVKTLNNDCMMGGIVFPWRDGRIGDG
jgi:hypothetical protein